MLLHTVHSYVHVCGVCVSVFLSSLCLCVFSWPSLNLIVSQPLVTVLCAITNASATLDGTGKTAVAQVRSHDYTAHCKVTYIRHDTIVQPTVFIEVYNR